ncbi:MAG: hypothetical protein ACI9KE_002685 [Polyangiales bacterium]|jgi:hypothetical protein
MNSRITQAITDLHALFDDELEGVSFPDVDGEALLALQTKVDDSRTEVERCEEALDAANRSREAEEEALLKAAIRAQKYMRIFASENEELFERVDGLELEDKPAKKKVRKTRKPKQADTTISLALDEPALEEVEAQENAA